MFVISLFLHKRLILPISLQKRPLCIYTFFWTVVQYAIENNVRTYRASRLLISYREPASANIVV